MAERIVLVLNQSVPQIQEPQAGDTYGMPRDLNVTGNITVTGTVDGRDVAADGALAATATQPGDNLSTLVNDIIASQGEAEAGADNTKIMTPLRVAQAIAVLAAGLLNKLDATVDPIATNDETQGYAVGSFWVNVTSDECFRCVDATTNVAVWVRTTLQTSDLATVALSGDSDDLSEGATKKLLTAAERTKLGYITVTGAASLDSINTKVGYLTVTQAVDLDTLESDVSTLVTNAIPAYGEIYCTDNATGETTVDATPRAITAWTSNGPASGATPDHTIDEIQADVAGKYFVDVSLSFSGSASSTYLLEIYKNGVATGFQAKRKLGTGGDVGAVGFHGIIALAATDDVKVYQSSTDGGTAMTVTDGQLSIVRLGA